MRRQVHIGEHAQGIVSTALALRRFALEAIRLEIVNKFGWYTIRARPLPCPPEKRTALSYEGRQYPLSLLRREVTRGSDEPPPGRGLHRALRAQAARSPVFARRARQPAEQPHPHP